ncbi:uncharacterized protein [Penaeus vannamei]|uniref:uncharacterized protein n=1 Tax=Penaeus vannamei TaxID=6689 RepID=UPI00387F8D7D
MNTKHTVLKKAGDFICWLPEKGFYSLVLSLQDYKPFNKLSRTVHFHVFQDIQKLRRFSPRKNHILVHSHLGSRYPSCEVVWFGAHNPHEETSVYGNASFILDMREFMQEHVRKCNIYFVEVLDFKSGNTSRILITHKKYDLPHYDPLQYGGPWYIDPSGKHYYLQNARRYNGLSNRCGHKLEFMLELTEEEAERLFHRAVPQPVGHQEANSGKPYCCKDHGPSKSCPSPWSKKEAQERINKELETRTGNANRSLKF